MGIRALNLEAIDRFVSPSDPDYRPNGKHLPGATVFLLGTIDSIQLSALKDGLASYTEDGGMQLRSADNDLLAARLALRGWENFDADFMAEETYIRGHKWMMAAEECVRRIPLDTLREIGARVKTQNSIGEELGKNSDSASSQSNSTPTETVEDAPSGTNAGGDAPQSVTLPKKAK